MQENILPGSPLIWDSDIAIFRSLGSDEGATSCGFTFSGLSAVKSGLVPNSGDSWKLEIFVLASVLSIASISSMPS